LLNIKRRKETLEKAWGHVVLLLARRPSAQIPARNRFRRCLADEFQNTLAFLGIESSHASIRQPDGG